MYVELILLFQALVWAFAAIAWVTLFAGAVAGLLKKRGTGTNMTQTRKSESNKKPERDGISGTELMSKEELQRQVLAATKRVQPNSYALADAALIQLWEKVYGNNLGSG